MEHEEVTEPHGYGRNDDDEEATIHSEILLISLYSLRLQSMEIAVYFVIPSGARNLSWV